MLQMATFTNRKHFYNENYFDIIDCKRKAYWLGWLYADGYNNQKQKVVSLELQALDIDILNKFNSDLSSERHLSFRNVNNKYPNQQNTYKAIFSGKHLSDRLSELGCIQAKSMVIKFPTKEQVPPEFIKDFLLGYFEGNGSFSIRYHKKSPEIKCNISSTLDFCSSALNFIESELFISGCICVDKGKEHTTSRKLNIGGNQQVYKLLSWWYHTADIYLERKYNKFRDFESILINYGTINESHLNRWNKIC